ncbi:MAG TPA: ATP-binding protein [Acidimicrobiales bacterium]|nr:ATP-binding protein [Acidimicrobiales bacterium]
MAPAARTSAGAPARAGNRPAAGDPPADYLRERLELVRRRVAAAAGRRRASEWAHVDGGHGLFVSDEEVDALLRLPLAGPPEPLPAGLAEAVEEAADRAEARGADIRVRRLAASFALGALDVEILLVALAPDVDRRFERLYGYLHDDLGRRRASVGLALELCGRDSMSAEAHGRLHPDAPLRRWGLLEVEDGARPLLARSLRVPDRVISYLLGGDAPDPDVRRLTTALVPAGYPATGPMARALREGIWLLYIRERPGTAAGSLAAGVFAELGVGVVGLDLRRLPPDLAGFELDPRALAVACVREATLAASGLVLGPIDLLVGADPRVVQVFVDAPVPVVLTGPGAWEPRWTDAVPLVVEAPPPDLAARERLWADLLEGAELADDLDLRGATGQYTLTPEQTWRAARAAGLHAGAAGRPVDEELLREGVRAQNAGRLEARARRIPARATFADLVLPARVLGQLEEISEWARWRDRVRGEWGMGGKGSKGHGVTALFAGSSGTGKTLSAEAIASSLGFDLYAIDLSTVVDKYIGETEKHLERIFEEAEGVNGVLFFDEADALFGKRSETKEAKDRYANVEVAYLLQRMEQFNGVAVLATNLQANLDEAFTRRLDTLVVFPDPEEPERRRLWDAHLPATLPRAGDLDLDFLARAFVLTGGDIRNICLAAAHRAAPGDRAVAMADLVWATGREYRKLGRLCTEAEFGPYFDLVRT